MSEPRTFKLTVLPLGRTVEAREGHTVLEVCLWHGIELDHACGGVCACSTCHVHVKQGGEHSEEASEKEEDMLDNAPCLTTQSRLGCQVEIHSDMVVEIPPMNRNLISEGH
jgi:2Fe-2S ferredoxin